MARFKNLFIGVNRRRFGLALGDLSALDGKLPVRTPAVLSQRKNRNPRRLKVGRVPFRFGKVRRRRRQSERPGNFKFLPI